MAATRRREGVGRNGQPVLRRHVRGFRILWDRVGSVVHRPGGERGVGGGLGLQRAVQPVEDYQAGDLRGGFVLVFK